MTLTPALRRLALDPRLGSLAIRVYVFVAGDLDYRRFKAIKLITVAAALGTKRHKVGNALRALTEAGYLERDGRAWAGGPYTYRLNYLIDEGPDPVTPKIA